ncbi:MAG: type III-B CRISPR module RAMP protein Cmr6 [Chloroflexi bacterium]|nr:type III-B CRISPR module RAMP protein Cmr6 [Chloroflexota bacterium]
MPTTWQIPRDLAWGTPYPLPRDTAETVLEREQDGRPDNASLLMDRLLPYARGRAGPEIVREFTNRAALLPDLTRLMELIAAIVARWDALAQSLGAVTFTAEPEWRVAVGLGTHPPLETGLLLHRTYGLPFIPASALKGVTRLYAERVADIGAAEASGLFGATDDEAERGDLLFLDAFPAAVPRLERDVINAHFATYYAGLANTPPADYLAPRPVFFLTVGRASPFRFGIASAQGDRLVAERGAAWLRQALRDVGVGAKTATGYGYWIETRGEQ